MEGEEKLEWRTRITDSKNLDAYIIQETHLAGDYATILPQGNIFIHHGPKTQPLRGAKGGVAIVLSEELGTLWKKNGSKVLRGGPSIGATTRYMRVDVKLKLTNSKSKIKTHTLSLVSSYHPHSGYKTEELDAYNESIADFIDSIPKNNTIIMGADLNASISTRKTKTQQEDPEDEREEDIANELLGPNGNPHRNQRGEAILNMIRALNLRAVSTFFDCNDNYDTWINPGTKEAFQIDHILIPKNQLIQTSNVKCKFDGPPSDHAALTIHLNLPNGNLLPKKRKKAILKATKKINNHILRTSGAATFKNKVSDFIPSLTPEEITSLPHTELLDRFEKHIVHAAMEAAQIEVCNRPDWFTQSETILLELITIRNRTYKLYVQNRNELIHTNLQTTRSNLQREKRNAKQRWQLHFAEKCK